MRTTSLCITAAIMLTAAPARAEEQPAVHIVEKLVKINRPGKSAAASARPKKSAAASAHPGKSAAASAHPGARKRPRRGVTQAQRRAAREVLTRLGEAGARITFAQCRALKVVAEVHARAGIKRLADAYRWYYERAMRRARSYRPAEERRVDEVPMTLAIFNGEARLTPLDRLAD